MEHNAPKRLEGFLGRISTRRQGHFAFLERASASNSVSWTGVLADASLLKSSQLADSFWILAGYLLTPELSSHLRKIWDMAPLISDPRFHQLPVKGMLRHNNVEG